ncbi:MAG: ABC transporter ATP-binding protein [Chloroflexi bacterium]|nr:ABC transporter ATP-binding protein [Chloroflexota bacterium]
MIRTEGLKKAYRMGQMLISALNGVDLSIRRGEFVAIMGPSGSGKSTLLNVIGMLDTPTAGRVFIGGRDVSSLDESQRADLRLRQIGFVFQFFNLFPELTALENVMLPLMIMAGKNGYECRDRAASLLNRVGLGHRQHHKPSELSGGQQQRATIARALINEPAMLLADEPTANLDSQTAATVLDLLRQLNMERGQTIVLVTHEAEWGTRADRIVRLRDGKVA